MNHYCINKRNNKVSKSSGNCVEFLPSTSVSSSVKKVYSKEVSNALLNAAMPLLILMIKLKNTNLRPDVEEINAQATREIRIFEACAEQMEYAANTILAASYCLCATFDEAVLSTSWGSQSAWVQHTLLSKIHHETWGGERFYAILNKMLEQPSNNLDILELFYSLLSLGFEGKYFNEGKEMREELRSTLFDLIKSYRDVLCESLSPRPIDEKIAEYKAQKRIAPKHVGVIMAGAFIFLLVLFNYQGYVHAIPLLEKLKIIANSKN